MTLTINLLQRQKTKFVLHSYKYDANILNFGREAVEKLGLNAKQVFKTLLVSLNGGSKNLVVHHPGMRKT